MTKTLGGRIAATRESRGMNKSQLAKLLKVTPTAVWNWEENDVNPRPPMLSKIARALGVQDAYLLTGQTVGAKAKTAADVIAGAADEIAALNGVPVSRVKISFQIT